MIKTGCRQTLPFKTVNKVSINTSKGWKNLTNNFEKEGWEYPDHDFSWKAGNTDPTNTSDEYEKLKTSKKFKKGEKSRASHIAGYLVISTSAEVRRGEINTAY